VENTESEVARSNRSVGGIHRSLSYGLITAGRNSSAMVFNFSSMAK
jgi:hypothetical protein